MTRLRLQTFFICCMILLAGFNIPIFVAAQSPGGVAGAKIWLRADNGTFNINYLNVPAASRSASSSFSGLTPDFSTLASGSSWAASTAVTGQFITLDLGSAQTVDGVVTKGRGNSAQWVTTFTVTYSTDNITYTPIGGTYRANTDQNTEVTNVFSSSVTARYIRITETGFNGHPSMRVDAITTVSNTTHNTTIGVWRDGSGNGNIFTKSALINQPLLLNNNTSSLLNMNFNPLIKYDGSNDILEDPDGFISTNTYTVANAFIVSRADAIQNSSVFFEALGTGTQYNLHLPWSDAVAYWDGPNGASNNQRLQSAWGSTVGVPNIWTGFNGNASEVNKRQFRRDGLQLASNTAAISYTGNSSRAYVGSGAYTNYFNGAISEIVIYTTSLSALDRQRIESYLALKYGRTLDQTTPTNYIASDGATIMWNATTGATFKANIAGIGRDDASGLNQKQSVSGNSANEVVIGLGSIAATNAANSNTFGADKTFMTWGG